MAKRNNRTNFWDYLTNVSTQKTIRVEARNQTKVTRIENGDDLNAIVKDFGDEYGGQVLDLAAQAAGAAAGVPVNPGSLAAASAATPAAAPSRTFSPRPGGGMPGKSSSSLPSWALPVAIGLGAVVLLRKP